MKLLEIYDTLDNGQTYNGRFLPDKYDLPEHNSFFGFRLKHFNVVNRMIYANTYIERLWEQWHFLKSEPIGTALAHLKWQQVLINDRFVQADFISNLRKIVDDCLSLFSVATNHYNSKGMPFESIGEYKQQEKEKNVTDFAQNSSFLSNLNNVSNAFKHSILGEEMLRIGLNEPCIFIIHLEAKSKEAITVNDRAFTLEYFVNEFNTFYKRFDEIIKN